MLSRDEAHRHAMQIAADVEKCAEWDGECDPPHITRIGFEEWLTDYLMALLPDAESLGRAAYNAVSHEHILIGAGWVREPQFSPDVLRRIGHAILEALRKEREG